MKRIVSIVTLVTLSMGFLSLFAQAPDYSQLKQDAEAFYAEGSYAKANELYQQARTLSLTPEQKRWVDFRLADTTWRSEAATNTADDTKLQQARHDLEVLVRDVQRPEDRDQIWAEVQQSLGDFWWTRRDNRNWNQAWPHYQLALDWWAGSSDMELARARYLKIVWTMTEPPAAEPFYVYGNYGNWIPVDILENVLKIATVENDKAHAHYLLALTLHNQAADVNQRRRVSAEFKEALKAGKTTRWYDAALFSYAQWVESNGRIVTVAEGQETTQPDYVKAVSLYRRLITEYQQGESRFYTQAKLQLEAITRPSINVGASNIFLPGSKIQFSLSWRNVKTIEFSLYEVDLNQDVQFPNREKQMGGWTEWIQRVDFSHHAARMTWSRSTNDRGNYQPGSERVRLDDALPAGAYLLQATAAGTESRDLLLVSDSSLVLKTSGKQALVYFCNALDGSPHHEAAISLWKGSYDYKTQAVEWKHATQQANTDGLVMFDLGEYSENVQIFVSAKEGDRQAFASASSYAYAIEGQSWRIYAFTDRPAYRPKEQVHWKFVARQYNGSTYSTPSNQSVEYEISDPRGSRVKQDRATLNAFGSAWGSLDLTESMPLGEYRITFWNTVRTTSIGSAALFRLEEYKLPEFKVAVKTPEENGKRKTFLFGEQVKVNIQADYYFGGAVSDATVEVLVSQRPFFHRWHPPHDYPWFYEDMFPPRIFYGDRQDQIIKRETLKTDPTGRAVLTFEPPAHSDQDFEYFIEARVTDASRREISGNGTVRVTRQEYFVYPKTTHHLYRPHEKVAVDVKSLDANDQPLPVEGRIKVTRDSWYEIWLNPSDREVKGNELTNLRRRFPIFPPPLEPGQKGWRLKFRGYEHEDILSQPLKTDSQGLAEFSFIAERPGYYRIGWTSRDRKQYQITAETTAWVTDSATTQLGYHHDGVEIIVDRDTFHAGQTAAVMLSVPTSDRYVLFTIEGDQLYHYQLVHVAGNVKLLEIPIPDAYVPNVFLSATLVSDRSISLDTKQVVVPPVKQFLSVEVTSDHNQYQPREEGTFTIKTSDHAGKPVAAEVSLALVDESVFYIQKDYAGDPRQFYFGTKRWNHVQNQSTFNQKQYTKLVEGPDKELVDEFELSAAHASGQGVGGSYGRGVAGGVLGGMVSGAEGRITVFSEMGSVRKEMSLNGSMDARTFSGVNQLVMANGAVLAPPPAASMQNQEPAVQVRSDFRSTVFWQPDVITSKDGTAVVKVKYPDSLTAWKATARAETEGSQFGMTSITTHTQQPLIVRLEGPRFFVVGDTLTISAVVNNNTDKPFLHVSPSLEAAGLRVLGAEVDGRLKADGHPDITVPPQGEARADWLVSVEKPGEARLKVTARSRQFADAMERSFPIYEHGIEKFVARSGKMRGDEILVQLPLPKERKVDSTTLQVQITPTLAVTMLDALPYLIDYPYGCTEQTMSRFLPAAITAKTLKDLGIDPEQAMGKAFGGIEPESAAATHPKGKKNLQLLDDIAHQSLERLYDFQHPDGGWGWWKEGVTDHFMTAYVVWGMTLARQTGIPLKPGVLDRGVDYLRKTLVEEEMNADTQAWMLHALSVFHAASNLKTVGKFENKAFDNLWINRDRLNAYARALLALSAHHLGYNEQARTLIRNLENGVKLDKNPEASILLQKQSSAADVATGTAHWGEDGIYWRWSDGGVEATATVLRALLAIDPQNKLIEPVTHWLIKNRRGAQWNNTRDTAMVILTLEDYLRTSGELRPDVEFEFSVNGHFIARKAIRPDEALMAPSLFSIDSKYLADGINEIKIHRLHGQSPLYFSAQTKYFSLEEPIPAAGNEIFVRRQYFKLVGHPTLLKGFVYDRVPLNDGDSVNSGDRIQTVVTIEAKNNYEYLVFEDLKPAGLEAVQIRSGEPVYAQELKSETLKSLTQISRSPAQSSPSNPAGPVSDYTGRSRWVYQELRDRKVALFLDKLTQGLWEIRYDLRAEVPGHFHALPVVGYAMYVPEIRANGDEVRITVEEKK